jgi:hypothetical protein
VRNAGVRATLDGEVFADLPTDYYDLDMSASWNLRDPGSLGVATYSSAIEIGRLELTEVSGSKAVATRSTAPVPRSGITATKDSPFVNTLGMRFVPVPIGGGPTKDQVVLFSVWDTRVQDFAAFAVVNKVDDGWTKANREGVPAGRKRDHPVVGVRWEDLPRFCQWLTKKEQAEGKLPGSLKYRLPSDEEWSYAVGLPPEPDGTPAEKSGKNRLDFPWGKSWPPPDQAGNYADETFHRQLPKHLGFDQPWLAGYEDGYATTSPVGSFPANAYGLFDMGGNVRQWCQDSYDKDPMDRVARGASWSDTDSGYMLSSNRFHTTPNYSNNRGFRCVLAPATILVPGEESENHP